MPLVQLLSSKKHEACGPSCSATKVPVKLPRSFATLPVKPAKMSRTLHAIASLALSLAFSVSVPRSHAGGRTLKSKVIVCAPVYSGLVTLSSQGQSTDPASPKSAAYCALLGRAVSIENHDPNAILGQRFRPYLLSWSS